MTLFETSMALNPIIGGLTRAGTPKEKEGCIKREPEIGVRHLQVKKYTIDCQKSLEVRRRPGMHLLSELVEGTNLATPLISQDYRTMKIDFPCLRRPVHCTSLWQCQQTHTGSKPGRKRSRKGYGTIQAILVHLRLKNGLLEIFSSWPQLLCYCSH